MAVGRDVRVPMYPHGLSAHDRSNRELNPGWDTIARTWLAAVLGPIAVMAVVSHPTVGVGLLVAGGLSFVGWKRRRGRHPDAERKPSLVARRETDRGRGDDRHPGGW